MAKALLGHVSPDLRLGVEVRRLAQRVRDLEAALHVAHLENDELTRRLTEATSFPDDLRVHADFDVDGDMLSIVPDRLGEREPALT